MKSNSFSAERWLLQSYALSDKPGELRYKAGSVYNSGQGRLLESEHNENNENENFINIPVACLNDLFYQEGLPIPTIMKLDVEGWELKVLNGAQKLFSEHPPRLIIFEAYCEPSGKITDNELVKFFESRDYVIHHLERKEGVVLENENYVAVNLKKQLVKSR